jgi:hypothetical protein
MKKYSFLTILLVIILFTACKKDYDCSAIDANGNETIFKCENCSSKDKDDYEQAILDKGYASATCEKK